MGVCDYSYRKAVERQAQSCACSTSKYNFLAISVEGQSSGRQDSGHSFSSKVIAGMPEMLQWWTGALLDVFNSVRKFYLKNGKYTLKVQGTRSLPQRCLSHLLSNSRPKFSLRTFAACQHGSGHLQSQLLRRMT